MTLRALGRDVAIYGTGEFVFKFIAFAVFPIYAHILTLAEFGTWALLTATATLLGYLVNMGVNQAVQRHYFERGERDQAGIVSTGLAQLLASCVAFALIAILAVSLAGDTFQERYGIDGLLLLLALAIVIPDQLMQFCLDLLRMHFTPLKFLLLAFAKNIVGTAAALYMVAVAGAGLHGLFAGLLAGSLAALPLGLWLIRRDLKWSWDAPLAKALFAFGFPLTFTSIAHWIYTAMDRWMLAEMSSASELGLYSVAAKYATVLTFVIAAFAQAWIPLAMRTAGEDPGHQTLFGRVLSHWYGALAILALGIALFAPEALMFLTPRDYWPAAAILPMLVAGLVLFGTTQVTALGITLENRTILTTWAAWIAALANFGLNLALIPQFGALGSAAATLISYALLTGFMLYWTQRLRPIPLQRPALVYCTALTVAAAALSLSDFAAATALAVALKSAILAAAIAGAFAVGAFDRSLLDWSRIRGASWQRS